MSPSQRSQLTGEIGSRFTTARGCKSLGPCRFTLQIAHGLLLRFVAVCLSRCPLQLHTLLQRLVCEWWNCLDHHLVAVQHGPRRAGMRYDWLHHADCSWSCHAHLAHRLQQRLHDKPHLHP